jgi:hypothetical protein
MKTACLTGIIILFWGVALLSAFLVEASAQDPGSRLFRNKFTPGFPGKENRHSKRMFDVNHKVFAALHQGQLKEITLPINGQEIVFYRHFFQRKGQIATWTGKDAPGQATVLLTIANNHCWGRITLEDQSLLLKPTGWAWQMSLEREDAQFQVPFLQDHIAAPSSDPPAAFALPEYGDDGLRIDVMVLYTSGMGNAYPGSQIDTRIQYLIDQANLAFQNSNIPTRFNLVFTQEVNYPDDSPGNLFEALDDLAENRGVFSDVELLRTLYGADQVTLLRQLVDEGCGLAYLLPEANPRYAYAVVHDGRKTNGSGSYCSDLTLAHEIGHNLGCAHDRANASSPGRYYNSYGYQQPAGAFRTVMAYNCTGGCPEIAYFSDPGIWFNGFLTGVAFPLPASANNAETIRNTGREMANYKTAMPPSITVSIPNGSESWHSGRRYEIKWSSSATISGDISIELYQNGQPKSVIRHRAPDSGAFDWLIPESLAGGSTYQIRISSVSSPEIFDISDYFFRISRTPSNVIYPAPYMLLLDDD